MNRETMKRNAEIVSKTLVATVIALMLIISGILVYALTRPQPADVLEKVTYLDKKVDILIDVLDKDGVVSKALLSNEDANR